MHDISNDCSESALGPAAVRPGDAVLHLPHLVRRLQRERSHSAHAAGPSLLAGVCHPATTASKTTSIVIGALLSFLAIVYSALQTSTASQMSKLGLGSSAAYDGANTVLLPTTNEDAGEGKARGLQPCNVR